MSTPDIDEPRFCGNCGSQLLPDKRCPNKCTVVTYVNDSSPSYTNYSIPPTQPGLPIYTPPPSNQKNNNKMYLLVIAILLIILIGAGIFAGILIGKNSTQANTGLTPTTLNSSRTTPTTVATSSAQSSPTTLPSPTVTPPPKPGDILYQADSSWSGWSGSPDWHIANGMLVNDGTAEGGGPTIVAPYQSPVSDYAVEANIQVVHWNTCCIAQFAIVVRASSNNNGWQGYSVGDDIASFAGPQYVAQVSSSTGDYGSSLGSDPFDPGSASHLYRIEVKGNNIKFFIDGGLKLSVNDNTYLTGGQVGLWSFGVQLNITSFKIIAL